MEAAAGAAGTRKAELQIRFSEFEIPPMQDVLLVGRRAPIGPEAARRMVDAVCPDQYEIITLDHPVFEAAVIRRPLLRLVPVEKLVAVLIEEVGPLAAEDMVVKAQVKAVVQVTREVEL